MKNSNIKPPKSPVFVININGKNVYPGSGEHESIHPSELEKYVELSNIKDWRKLLSNFFHRDGYPLFELDGYHWNSVEHYLHAQKFKSNPQYYRLFTYDRRSDIGCGSGSVARNAGFMYAMVPADRIAWNEQGRSLALTKALNAKFSQNEDLRRSLLATLNATLVYKGSPYSKMTVEDKLMNLRDCLKQTE